MERALEEAGVSPQVVASPAGVTGMTPLQHAQVTVIKLHGDYADLQMRNTIDELSTYPAELDSLLDRVLDEYGLIISGWSADWDTALVAALERLKSRRYPLYWDSRSSKGETARRLLAQHSGVVTPASSADELFTGLVDRIDALDRLAEPPLTTAVAVARLKRYLPDPVRRIDLDDLVTGAVSAVVGKAAAYPTSQNNLTGQALDEQVRRPVRRCHADSAPACRRGLPRPGSGPHQPVGEIHWSAHACPQPDHGRAPGCAGYGEALPGAACTPRRRHR